MAAPVNVGAHRLVNVSTDGRNALGELRRCYPIYRQPLMVDIFELFELITFESF
ncbi:MAG: hypothetical protein AAF171_04705 [Cyanobacteria bacterium P01_A01_bin.116]